MCSVFLVSTFCNQYQSYSPHVIHQLMIAIYKMQEFYRLCSNLRAKREHASLLEDFREYDRSRLDLEDGISPEQVLLKENASISRSTGQVYLF